MSTMRERKISIGPLGDWRLGENIVNANEIDALKQENEDQGKKIAEQDQRIAELEKKYEQLLMMVGRGGN
ncbi:hypothetical protein PRIPAC_92682 [Pristionchus pacificus]|uniref:Uncharacterized protein n=1 Tax=Pristionchus pacificus TaxID=54126 RepID=A0A2A6BB88_PRIPA|nr:hypothetical protein PRIPAC_92682 [Pristionchus pacificus]|eukprot:PDM63124.1 hypothetical protein PRIPAC_50339 [Pristionchus pacificus]